MNNWRIISIFIGTLFLSLSSHANVVGADTQNFNPTNDGLDFVTVHSPKTLAPGLLNLGLFVNYAVNSLPNYENTTTQTRTNFQDSLLSSDFNFGLGLTKSWEMGISVPQVLDQKVESDGTNRRGQYGSTGMTEFRLMTKARLWGRGAKGVAAIVSGNFNQIERNPFLGEGAGPTYNFELAGGTKIGKFQWGLNVGYRLRDPGAPIAGVPVTPLGSQYIASTALSYLISSWHTKVITEVFGSIPEKKQASTTDRSDSTAEFLLGFKTDISKRMALHFGGGTEILHGTSSPDWRVYTGINWVLGPFFGKPKHAIAKIKPVKVKKTVAKEPELIEPVDINDIDPFEGPTKLVENFVVRDILFHFDSADLSEEAPEILQKLVNHLAKPPGFKTLSIQGHTDYIGTPEYNWDLSHRRANSVLVELIRLGLPKEKLSSSGFGFTRPIADNGNYQGRALNRRVEFHVQR